MTRRSVSLALDAGMLVVFVSLMSWRLTGIVAGIVVTLGTRTLGAALPAQETVLMIFPDGHREVTGPPNDIARLHPGTDVPDPARGGPRALLRFVMLGVVTVVGRTVLKLRLA